MAQPERAQPNNKAATTKGLTKEGKPRQRAYRTYYAVNAVGLLVRFPTYEAREAAIKAGECTRITAHEARERQTQGEQAVTLAAARAVSPHRVTSPTDHVTRTSTAHPEPTLARDPPHRNHVGSSPNINPRDLVEAQILVDQALQVLETIKHKVLKLGK